MSVINIAIDGPAGAGKSTVAKSVAKLLGITYLDTGAMYRACAYVALQRGLSVTDDVDDIISMMDDITMRIEYGADGTQSVIVNDEDVSGFIRQHHISQAASDISKIPEVRLKLVELQRKIAKSCSCVLDGRDITSYVLPNADFKFYLDASPSIRAQRRCDELAAKGQKFDYDAILQSIITRDNNDMSRSFAPLTRTKDSVYIDTSDMTIEEVQTALLSYANR